MAGISPSGGKVPPQKNCSQTSMISSAKQSENIIWLFNTHSVFTLFPFPQPPYSERKIKGVIRYTMYLIITYLLIQFCLVMLRKAKSI